MASAPPAELKVVTPFLQRAAELKAADPVIAYWCLYHAAQLGMSLKPKEPGSTPFLMGLLDQLEALRKDMLDNDAVTDEAAGSAYVENFALKVFTGADAEDRAGKATRATAKRFLAAVNFLELLSNFATPDEETLARIKYARWKAADIAKAFREGRQPTPGPAGGLDAAPSPAEVDAAALPPTDGESKEVEQQLLGVGQNGTGHKSELPEIDAAPPIPRAPSPSYPFPDVPSAAPRQSSLPTFVDDLPDETPTTPSVNPVTPGFPQMPTSTGGAPALPPPPASLPSQPPTSAFPSAVLPSAPVMPAAAPMPAAPEVPDIDERPPQSQVDPVKVAESQKHAKWAISALNYDDLPTARKELRLALSLIS